MSTLWSDITAFQQAVNRHIDTYGTMVVLMSIATVAIAGVIYLDIAADMQELSVQPALLLASVTYLIWSALMLQASIRQRHTYHVPASPTDQRNAILNTAADPSTNGHHHDQTPPTFTNR